MPQPDNHSGEGWMGRDWPNNSYACMQNPRTDSSHYRGFCGRSKKVALNVSGEETSNGKAELELSILVEKNIPGSGLTRERHPGQKKPEPFMIN